MKCTKCGIREATTEVLRRHNNHVEKMYLCDECASDYKPDTVFKGIDMLGSFLSGSPMGLLGNLGSLFDAPAAKSAVCPICRTTSDEFMRTGYVGCPHCYEVFEPLITQTVKKIQQSDRHVGKVPVGAVDLASEEAKLKSELQAAVDSGDYIKTAEISNKLKKLIGGSGEGY